MSDPLTNMEIQDVLSSIRRLVSEDSRRRPADSAGRQSETVKRDDPGDAISQEPGKLVLTEALRVDEDRDVQLAASPIARGRTSEEDEAFHEGRVTPAGEDRTRDDAGSSAGIADWDQDATRDVAETGSLEDTIAELEAAVAGIGDDFEPDGSEMAAEHEAYAELDEAFEDGFVVDSGDDPDVAELSQPVTGAGANDWLAAGKASEKTPEDEEAVSEDADVLVLGASEERGTIEAASDTEDDEVVGDRDQSDDDGLSGAIKSAVEGAADDLVASAAVPAFRAHRSEAAHPSEPLKPGGGEAPLRRLHLGAAEAVSEPESDEADAPGPAQDERLHLTSVSGDRGADTDNASVFKAGAVEGALDRDELRSLVAEILREELKGPLGERITRNLRALVRSEVQRALEGRENE